MKELLQISKIFSQCKKYYREIWNLKNAILIDREDFKTQNEAKNYKFIQKARLFMQKQINHCKQDDNAKRKKLENALNKEKRKKRKRNNIKFVYL